MSRSVNKRKDAQQREREGAQRLQLALSAGQLGDWSWDAASDRITWGARAAQCFGLTHTTPITWEALRDLLHPDDRDRARAAIETALRDRSDYDIEYRVRRPDGAEAWIASKGLGVYDDDGNVVGMIGVVQDVTERKKLELVQHRLAAVVESSDDAIISKDLNGIIQTWNPGAERIFGYSAAEMIGTSILRLIPTELRGEETTILDRQRRGERIDHYETVRVTKDGRRIDVSLTVSPIRDASGTVVGASKVARDITSRKQAEREMLDAERHARSEAERISFMKDEFLATLSHELRTPLNAIVGWSQLLRNRAHLDGEVLEGLTVIDRNAKVQAQLIEDLLDMSRIISGKVRLDNQRLDIQEVVRASIASVRHLAEAKEIKLDLELGPPAGPVWGDPNRLQQCIWNLVSNAIKFTPKGGEVKVAVVRTADQIEFTVIDNGQGIDPVFLPHIFERFRQADSSSTRYHGGLGLGLSIVKSLVELHGGWVRANSDGLGKGARFSIGLPAMAASTVPADIQREPAMTLDQQPVADQTSLHGLVVLVIDDEQDSLDLVKRVLGDCGARVFLAASARAGLEILQRERPDILISDIGMPDEDGYTLIRQVRALKAKQGGKIPAAAVSAFARPEDRTRALRAGYQMHLSKPVDPTELTAVVASLATRKSPVRARGVSPHS
jgi:PAS domain S-box-containing protein